MPEKPKTNEQRMEEGWDILKKTTPLGAAIETGNDIFNQFNGKAEKGKEKKTVVQNVKNAAEQLSKNIEAKKAEKILDSNEAKLTGQTVAPTAKAKEESLLDTLGNKFEHMQNFLAYHLAPLVEMLQKLKIPIFGDMQANVDMFLSFLGMERTMLFGSLRKQKLDPVFHTEDPEKDTDSINKLVAMAKLAHSYNPEYNIKLFFNEASADFAKHLGPNKKTFRLEELEEFARTQVLDKQITKAKEMPKESNSSSGQKLDIQLSGSENNISIMRNKRPHTLAKNAQNELMLDNKKLNVTLGNQNIVVTKLAIIGENIQITTDKYPTTPLPISPKIQDDFIAKIEAGQPYKDTYPFIGELVIKPNT